MYVLRLSQDSKTSCGTVMRSSKTVAIFRYINFDYCPIVRAGLAQLGERSTEAIL